MGSSKPLYIGLAMAVTLGACMGYTTDPPEAHGHRGCRGLLPENTVDGFLKAAELGVDWIEMDVVITGDGQVLVSHEPWMEHAICRTPAGDSITPAQERSFNIYRMSVAEVQAFDCGSVPHPDFPEQENGKTSKPTLREVVEKVEGEAMEKGLGNIGYNIEIKSDPALYDTYQPRPERFAQLVMEQIDSLMIGERCVIQSFDPAVLEAVHAIDADLPLSLLVDNADGLEANLARLSFQPAYYSLSFEQADTALVNALRRKDIELLVWTVNEPEDLHRMIDIGATGIITDYPDRLLELLEYE